MHGERTTVQYGWSAAVIECHRPQLSTHLHGNGPRKISNSVQQICPSTEEVKPVYKMKKILAVLTQCIEYISRHEKGFTSAK